MSLQDIIAKARKKQVTTQELVEEVIRCYHRQDKSGLYALDEAINFGITHQSILQTKKPLQALHELHLKRKLVLAQAQEIIPDKNGLKNFYAAVTGYRGIDIE